MKSVLFASLASACTAANIVELAQATPELSTLVQAVIAADLVDTLSSPGTFTVFAPTNDAFAALPEGVLGNLLKPQNKNALTDILLYHVLSDEYNFEADGFVNTVEGTSLKVQANSTSKFTITLPGVGAPNNLQSVATRGISASNGIVHVIDGVMLQSTREVTLTQWQGGTCTVQRPINFKVNTNTQTEGTCGAKGRLFCTADGQAVQAPCDPKDGSLLPQTVYPQDTCVKDPSSFRNARRSMKYSCSKQGEEGKEFEEEASALV